VNSHVLVNNKSNFLNQGTENLENINKSSDHPEKIHYFHKNKPHSHIANRITKLAISEKLPDYPPIYWQPFVNHSNAINNHHYIKLRQGDNFFYNQTFSESKEQFSSKGICDILENVSDTIYLSYINSNSGDIGTSYSLFKFEKNNGFYRVTEYNPYKKNLDGQLCSTVQTFYINCRTLLESLLISLSDNSLGFKDLNEEKIRLNNAFNSEHFSFLENGHTSIGNAITSHTSGISALLMAFNIVSEDFVTYLNNMEDVDTFINSEENKKHLRIKGMSREVRLDVAVTPCKRVQSQENNIVYPGTISSYINPEKMCSYPVVQGLDPRLPHSCFQQPYKITRLINGGHYQSISHAQMADIARQINQFLEKPSIREDYEKKYYSYEKITDKHIKNNQYNFTLGINGVTAKVNIPKFTPLIYKHQYAKQGSDEHLAIVSAMKNYVATHLNLQSKKANCLSHAAEVDKEIYAEAERLRNTYSWGAPPPFTVTKNGCKEEIKLWANAWGAGGIASGFNGDSSENKEHINHATVMYETVDKDEGAAPPIPVFISLRDIEKGEELLVDYGKRYIFTQAHKGHISSFN